jgi:S-adenosylmethionine synthetase
MYGYASNETPELMPLPIILAHKLVRRLAQVRKDKTLSRVRPDSKSQVTIEYEEGVALRVDAIVISTQHNPDITHDQITQDVIEHVIKPICGDMIDENTKLHINPT